MSSPITFTRESRAVGTSTVFAVRTSAQAMFHVSCVFDGVVVHGLEYRLLKTYNALKGDRLVIKGLPTVQLTKIKRVDQTYLLEA